MKHARRFVGSVDEPNAIRISRPPPSTDPSLHHEPPTAPFAINQEYVSEPASWLRLGELSSPIFNPHDFLQRALSDRFDKSSRPSQLPLLEDAFNADAALAALDTVESALRRMRDASRAEEANARDELRNSLHLAAKKRQSLLATAESVDEQVASFGEVGNNAASALAADLLSLEKHSSSLSELHDARDMLSLLVLDSSALGAVRVSRLLSRARCMLGAESLADSLSSDDQAVAQEELNRCAEDLAKSVFEWMRTAVDSGNSQVVKDCAVAASHLGVEEEFIRQYVKSAFTLNGTERDEHRTAESGSAVESFRHATWEVVSAIKEVIPTISNSFTNPSKPLASLLHMLIEKHIFRIANDEMNSLRINMQRAQKAVKEGHTDVYSSAEATPRDPNSNAFLSPSIPLKTNITQDRQADHNEIFVAQEHFLTGFADILRAITKVNAELFEICRVPAALDIETAFAKLPDPYVKFLSPLIYEYLESERAWIDDQLGAAFFEITRIESHTPHLAPRKRSDPEVYHHYRAFYSHIASTFAEMTKQAVKCTQKSLSRTLHVFRSLFVLMAKSEGSHAESLSALSKLPATHLCQRDAKSREGGNPRRTTESKLITCEKVMRRAQLPCTRSELQANLQSTTQELLVCTVMSYLANAETILQAAMHLLPVCEEDAQTQELWMSGASPLAAYAHAIDILSQSNMIVDDFLRHISENDSLEDMFGSFTCAEREGEARILPETVDCLQNELNNGLSDLGNEAQIGVRAAVSSLRIRLSSILASQAAGLGYASGSNMSTQKQTSVEVDSMSGSGFHVEPTPVFMSAATFLEQQLQSVVTTVKGGNRDFILGELARVTREAILDCWCRCQGPISHSGALQLISDAKAITRAFRNRGSCFEELECLSSIGQLFMESPDSLWCCVESKSLTHVKTSTIVTLLRKRVDSSAAPVFKVCQSLGVSGQDQN